MHYIFVFRSRNQSMRFYEALRHVGLHSKLISTPRTISVGCGLSVQVCPSNLSRAKDIFSYSHYDTFLGLFSVSQNEITRLSI